MQPCKRLEIVIETTLARRMEDLLAELQVDGYTMLPRASGFGNRGRRRADEPTGVASNCLFILACNNADDVTRIVEAVRPLLARSGGICLVSDAQWVKH